MDLLAHLCLYVEKSILYILFGFKFPSLLVSILYSYVSILDAFYF